MIEGGIDAIIVEGEVSEDFPVAAFILAFAFVDTDGCVRSQPVVLHRMRWVLHTFANFRSV